MSGRGGYPRAHGAPPSPMEQRVLECVPRADHAALAIDEIHSLVLERHSPRWSPARIDEIHSLVVSGAPARWSPARSTVRDHLIRLRYKGWVTRAQYHGRDLYLRSRGAP